jgi:hypothetical protein
MDDDDTTTVIITKTISIMTNIAVTATFTAVSYCVVVSSSR